VRIESIRPSPENEKLYGRILEDDPEVVALANSIRDHGVKEPLVVSGDRWIISGHKRYAACRLLGLQTVPARFLRNISREKNRSRFVKLLREMNRQRVKTRNQLLRETAIDVDPKQAYASLIEHRRASEIRILDTMPLRGWKARKRISRAKAPFLDAVKGILDERRAWWPVSDRQIHYALLNDPPLKHAGKPDAVYDNTAPSYKALVDLLTRARLEGKIPMSAIADPTRPVTIWKAWGNVQTYLTKELDEFGKGYWRDLMQTQPNHVEIVAEKNTIASVVQEVAARYVIPFTIGRGFCSLPPRYEMAKRFRKSGKERFVLLILSDFDPDAEEIAHSLARSLRDDFRINKVHPVKVALTADQVAKFNLPPRMQAKKTSTNYKRFVQEHGDTVHELEALEPDTLQDLLADAIDSVIDTDKFNHELDQEKQDAAFLEGVRLTMKSALGGDLK